MVSAAATVAAAGMSSALLYMGLCHPKVIGSPECSVFLNTLSLSLFIGLIYEMKEYNGLESNEPNAFVKSISNRTVGALLLVVFVVYTSISNAQVVRQVKRPTA